MKAIINEVVCRTTEPVTSHKTNL